MLLEIPVFKNGNVLTLRSNNAYVIIGRIENYNSRSIFVVTGNLSFFNIKTALKAMATKLIYQVLHVRQDRLRQDISFLNDLHGLFKRRLKPDCQATIDVVARFAG